jgi:hypothetical protein
MCLRTSEEKVCHIVTKSESIIPSVNLRKLVYSPNENPYMQGVEIQTKYKTVRTRAARRDLMDPETGEVVGASIIHTIEERDEEHFVKVFAEGVRAAFDLTKTGARVFQAVLMEYQKAKMTGGFSDSVNLIWFDDGLNGHALDMSDRTFHNGLKELIEKGFLKPKLPNQFWVNPALFFKGDRVAFMREYRIKGAPAREQPVTGTLEQDVTP